MDALRLVAGLLLPWWLGIAVLLAVRPRTTALTAPGEIAWLGGAGYLAGAFLLTLWMRVLSLAGIGFTVVAIALPLAAVAVVCTALVSRGERRASLRALLTKPELAAAARSLWWLLLGWLALRFVLLGVELATRPLYPWDAWSQWATKARVWYELGYLAPFARIEAWLAANGAVYFDASPEYPPTMPLLQVWSCIALGRWDDTLMNGPWWQLAVALTLAVYGGLRSLGAPALAAMVGAFLVASLPLANVHVALAGYADLPMAAWYTAAALAFLRWNVRRAIPDAAVALLLAIACTQIKNPGWFWAATLLPGLVVALSPRYGVRVALIGFAAAGVALVTFARFKLSLFNYRINLDFDPAWADLGQSYFLLGNWHLLWYGAIAAALLAWRQLFAPGMAALTMIVIGGLLFLFFVFGFTTASYYITDQTTVNRATLHLAPLIVVFMVLAWLAFARRWALRHAGAEPAGGAPAG
ncbi:MAG: hypothetical protein IT518_17390 [Burkholderiales bacterium]|nr:hypothetical protein [Burkholderiales bacterium]